MPTIGVRELKTRAADVIRRAEAGEAFVVTRRGRPVATIMPCPIEIEDMILAEAEKFVRMRFKARGEFARGKTTDWSTVRRASEPSAKYRAKPKK